MVGENDNTLGKNPPELPLSASQTNSQGNIQPLPASPTISAPPENKRLGKLTPIERSVLKRIKKHKEGEIKKIREKAERKPSAYMKLSSKIFYNFSSSLIRKGYFERLKRDLIKSNMDIIPQAYVSAIFFSTFVAGIVAFFIMIFFLFFNLSSLPPFVSVSEEAIFSRFSKVIWILILLPAITFIFTFLYPSMERKSLERRINVELPFAVIHMSAISSSMVEPSRLFGIIISTGEYPRIEKELIKLKNEINIYGYDLVTALRNRAYNSPSKKLAELFNGLATTITSGGNLSTFFDKRAQTLLFEYRLDVEKQSKSSETFMDIYLSVVIASPMVLMLLLIMMRISGLGISLSTSMITIIVVSVVAVVNIIALGFLQVRQSEN